jgi:hypothetical protein
MAVIYFAIFPGGDATPTWARANIGTNAGFSGSPTMYGTQADAPATGTNYEPTITWSSALTPGQSYKIAAKWDDGTDGSNVFESAAFGVKATLSAATYVPGSITSSAVRARVSVTVAAI